MFDLNITELDNAIPVMYWLVISIRHLLVLDFFYFQKLQHKVTPKVSKQVLLLQKIFIAKAYFIQTKGKFCFFQNSFSIVTKSRKDLNLFQLLTLAPSRQSSHIKSTEKSFQKFFVLFVNLKSKTAFAFLKFPSSLLAAWFLNRIFVYQWVSIQHHFVPSSSLFFRI